MAIGIFKNSSMLLQLALNSHEPTLVALLGTLLLGRVCKQRVYAVVGCITSANSVGSVSII